MIIAEKDVGVFAPTMVNTNDIQISPQQDIKTPTEKVINEPTSIINNNQSSTTVEIAPTSISNKLTNDTASTVSNNIVNTKLGDNAQKTSNLVNEPVSTI